MSKKKRILMILFFVVWIAVFLIGALLLQGKYTKHESIQESMRDAVLHETNQISLFGIRDVNPALISGFTVTGILLLLALVIRIFVIPRFKMMPGKFQMIRIGRQMIDVPIRAQSIPADIHHEIAVFVQCLAGTEFRAVFQFTCKSQERITLCSGKLDRIPACEAERILLQLLLRSSPVHLGKDINLMIGKALFQLVDRHEYHGLRALVKQLAAGNDDVFHFFRSPFPIPASL